MGNALEVQLAECPAATRLVGALYVAVSAGIPVLGGLAPQLHQHFLCSWWNVSQRGCFWTVLTSAFFRPCLSAVDVLMAGTELSMALSHFPDRERNLGSLRFLSWTLFATCGTNLLFLALMQLLRAASDSRSGRDYRFFHNQGLWAMIMVCVTMRSLKNPDARANVLGMAEVRHKWYPLCLVCGLSLLGGSVQYDSVSAMAYGYVHESLHLDNLVSCALARGFERRGLGRLLARRGLLGGAWVPPPADDEGIDFRGDGGWLGVGGGEGPPGRRDGGGGRGSGAGRRDFQPFGGQGHRLGSRGD